MSKTWRLVPLFALTACSGHAFTTAVATAPAELHVAPTFAPIGATHVDPIDTSVALVGAQQKLLGIDPRAAFTVMRNEISADGNDHVRMQQVYDNVKVWGSDVVVHSDGQNVTGVDG